jgi:ubiquinone/menaquinone biosynthesis C-methylase UbiE
VEGLVAWRGIVDMIDEERLSEVLFEGLSLRLVEPHIYSVYSPGEDINISYDKKFGVFYDLVGCNRFYNRLVWGYSTAEYHSLCLDALRSSTAGWVLDAGCGSLAFTAKAYVNYSERPIVLLDLSIELLMLAKSRLLKLNGKVPANIVFLHGDALQLPFEPKSFGTIISLNLLHVFEDKDVERVLQELRNVLLDGGTISLTTLIENNRFADKYLRMWGKAGEVVPRNANQLFSVFDALDMPIDYRIKGNLAFIYYR